MHEVAESKRHTAPGHEKAPSHGRGLGADADLGFELGSAGFRLGRGDLAELSPHVCGKARSNVSAGATRNHDSNGLVFTAGLTDFGHGFLQCFVECPRAQRALGDIDYGGRDH